VLRAKGRRRFILLHGVLAFGGLTSVYSLVTGLLVYRGLVRSTLALHSPTAPPPLFAPFGIVLGFSVLFCLLGGGLLGLLLWRLAEWQYNRHLRRGVSPPH
jgi:hypothetical protein